MTSTHDNDSTRALPRAAGDPAVTAASTDPEPPLVDVRDMIVVHTAMLREFRLAPASVSRTRPGDRKRAAAVAGHLRFVCDLLHHHHQGEDDLLWPTLRERAGPKAIEAIDEAEAQHHEIGATLRRVEQLRSAWADDPAKVNRDRLADELTRLHAVLRDHLDLEERALLPVAAMVLTSQEWRAIAEAGVAVMPKSTLLLAFGMFAYEGDPAVLRDMLENAPPVARRLLPVLAPRIYARRAKRIHGTATP